MSLQLPLNEFDFCSFAFIIDFKFFDVVVSCNVYEVESSDLIFFHFRSFIFVFIYLPLKDLDAFSKVFLCPKEIFVTFVFYLHI